jgi:ATP synthase protein I
MPTPDRQEREQGLAGYGKAYEIIAAALQLAVAVILMFFLGNWLDGKFNSAPWLMLTGLAVGFAGGFFAFLRSVQKMARGEDSAAKRNDNEHTGQG